MTRDRCYIGIDVGTGSARAGVFDASGKMLGQSSHPIKMWKPQADFVEQSSDDIWSGCAAAVRQAVMEADIDATNVRGIGFDATCSLVALDERDRPVSVSPTGNDEQNVIVHGVIERMLASLDLRERRILRQRFGLDEHHAPQTLEQIGRRFGVSKERIRQLETRAIRRLRTDFATDVQRILGS